MSEEPTSSGNDLPVHTDSNRQIVSRNLGAFSDEIVQMQVNNDHHDNVNVERNPYEQANTLACLNEAISYMKAENITMATVNKLTDDFMKLNNVDCLPLPLLTKQTQPHKSTMNHIANAPNETLDQRAERKRKRDSPEENSMRIRLKLQQYAYKSTLTGNKNVTFQLQADPVASQSVISMESANSERDDTLRASTSRDNPTRVNNIPRRNPPLLATEEEIRGYEVPTNKLHIWKLLETQLRKIGRHDARVSQLSEELATERPPSWCFGGTTAPSYLRPFNDTLVNITRAYTNTMAAAARQIIYNQAQDDQREANSLLETLRRMYEEDEDPNFELAHQRALGIATHYKEKEVALNRRLHQADIPNQPQTRAEWADSLGRRRVNKPGRSRSSRSRSPAHRQRNGSNNQAQPTQQTHRNNNPNPTRPNNNQPRQQPQQQRPRQQQQAPLQDNRYQARQQTNANPRSNNNSHGHHNAPQASGSNHNLPGNSRYNQARQGNQNTRQPTLDLNAEEHALINMMRAARSNNN